jgi:NNP family nitrate/nitrite transporter-like MFS transporter
MPDKVPLENQVEDTRSEMEKGSDHTEVGSTRVLVISTVAFTLMFAVWLMFGVLGVPIREEFGLTDQQLAWIISAAVLNGSIWRLPAGIAADRLGGRNVFVAMLLFTAIPAFLLGWFSNSYTLILFYAFLVGFAGNSFSAGIAWVSAWYPQRYQGTALGIFGAGNVGASATKFLGPAMIAIVPTALLGGLIPGGWRFVPFMYGILLIIMAVITWMLSPKDKKPGEGRSIGTMLLPLKQLRVWRFSLYYVVTFGAYVALAAWLPKYYVDVYGLELQNAALLTALFIFPASLLRPVGGYFSDKIGARKVMYLSFTIMLVSSGILMMPYGHIVLEGADNVTREVLPWSVGVWLFTFLVFLIGCAMGIGKAAVYKHIPEYFPADVGAVGGLVGSIGALGAVVLVPMFAFMTTVTGMEQATFLVLFLVVLAAFLWMHITIVMMLHKASPHLSDKFEHDDAEGENESANATGGPGQSDLKSETKQESPIGA